MKLHTTINFNEKQQKFESKIFKVQIMYKIDGRKNNRQFQVDVQQYHNKSKQIFTFLICQQPKTELKYKIQFHVKEKTKKPIQQTELKFVSKTQKYLKATFSQNQIQKQFDEKKSNRSKADEMLKTINSNVSIEKSLKKPILINTRSQHVLRFQVEQVIQQKQQSKINERSKAKNRTVNFNHQNNFIQPKNKKIGSEEKINTETNDQTSSKNEKQKMIPSFQFQKYQKIQKQNKKLKTKIIELQSKHEEKQKQLIFSQKKLQQALKKAQTHFKSLKQQNKRLQKIISETFEKPKEINLQQSLKPYKQRIKLFQYQISQINEQKNFIQIENRKQIQLIDELKQKIKRLNQGNLQNLQQLANKQYQIQKINKKLYSLENELKQHKLNQQKNQNQDGKNNDSKLNFGKSFKSLKVVGSNMGNDSISKLQAQINKLKIKLALTQKNLENKQDLLKKFDVFSQQSKKQMESQIQQLKKQNTELKKISGDISLKPSSSDSYSNLQTKILMQKLKKQIQYKTKSERQLLIQKSQLQIRNKSLQEGVVKSKEAVANILNIIQQFGNLDLIEEVNQFLG